MEPEFFFREPDFFSRDQSYFLFTPLCTIHIMALLGCVIRELRVSQATLVFSGIVVQKFFHKKYGFFASKKTSYNYNNQTVMNMELLSKQQLEERKVLSDDYR